MTLALSVVGFLAREVAGVKEYANMQHRLNKSKNGRGFAVLAVKSKAGIMECACRPRHAPPTLMTGGLMSWLILMEWSSVP